MVIKNVSNAIMHRRYFNRQGRELKPGEYTNVSGGASILDVMKDPTFLKDIGALKVANKAEIVVENADIPLKTLDLGTGTKLVHGKVSGSYAGLHLPSSQLITTVSPERKILVFVDRAEQSLIEDALYSPVVTDAALTTPIVSLYSSASSDALYNGALGDIRFAYTGKDGVAYTNQQDLTVGMPDSSGGLTVDLTLPTGYTMSACVSLTGGLTATRSDGDTISLVYAKTTYAAFSGVVQLTINGNLVQVPFTSGATAVTMTAAVGAGAAAAVAYKGDVAVPAAGLEATRTIAIVSSVEIDSIVAHADVTATVGETGLTATLVVAANAYAGAKSYEVAFLDAQGATFFKIDLAQVAATEAEYTVNVNSGGASAILDGATTATASAAAATVVYTSTTALTSATATFGVTTITATISGGGMVATFGAGTIIPANTDEVVAPSWTVQLKDADGARFAQFTLTQTVAAPAIQAKHGVGGTYVRVAPGGVFTGVAAGGEVVYVQTITDIDTATAGAIDGVVDGGKKFVAFTIPLSAANPGYRVSINNAAGATIHTLVLGQGTYAAGVAGVGDVEVVSAEEHEAMASAMAVEAPEVAEVEAPAEVVTESVEVVTEPVVVAPVVEAPAPDAPKSKRAKKQD